MSSNNKIYNKRWRLLGKGGQLFFLFILLSTSLFAQNIVIKGTVKDEVTRETLEGVAVQQVGAKNSTMTDKNGRFTISVPANAKLFIQYFGFKAETVQLKPGQTTIDIRLKKSIISLNEVTVNTGLYKRPVGNFTGSAKTYTGEELKSINPRSAIHALAAIDPAVRLTENNLMGSDPNQLPVIQIRGQNNLPSSLQGGITANAVTEGDIMSTYLSNPNQPLIILDGFQTTMQVIYDMDINLIASITVLKDAAATVAYGSKAANGVIVVETKQPTPGKLRVTYSINSNFELPDLSSYHLLDAAGILEAQRLAGVYNDPNNQFKDVALKQWYDYRLAQVKSGVNSYWLSQPVQIGWGTSHSLSMSGGQGALRYSFSGNYNNGEGAIKGSSRNRYGLGYTVAYVSKSIRLDNRTNVGYVRANNSKWGGFDSYASQLPYFRIKDDNGKMLKFFEPSNAELGFDLPAPGGRFANPAYNSTLNIKSYSTPLSISNTTNVEWSISDDFRIKGSFGWLGNSVESESFLPADHTNFGESIYTMTELGSYSQLRGSNSAMDGKINVNYNKRFGRHTLLASLGASITKTSSTSTAVNVVGIPNDYLDELGLANGFGFTNNKPNTLNNISRGLSNYVSLSYNFADRYTAEVTVNQSGSSQFGSNNRMAPFYAGGLAWSIDKEKFFKPNNIIQTAKLRASFGTTGNQNFATMSQQVYTYSFTNSYRLQLGATTSAYANPDLKWQQTLKQNAGLTLGLFKGRLNASVEVFRETTDNLILPLDVAPSTGFVNYQDNLGGTRNQGYEISFSAPIIKNSSKKIFWNININAGHYSNIITRLSPAIDAINAANNKLLTDDDKPNQKAPLPRFVVGESMSRIWAVPSLGIDPATGKEVFMKLDGSQTFTWDPNDKRPMGDATSKLKGIFSSNLSYKNFVFNIALGYQFGGYMYNQTLVDKVENVDLVNGNADVRVLTERWKKPGDISSFKSLVANGSNTLQMTNATSRFVQKNNFIEATSITVGYNFPSTLKWVKASHLSAPRLSITQNNVARLATIRNERGTSYPFARSFSFGLSTNF